MREGISNLEAMRVATRVATPATSAGAKGSLPQVEKKGEHVRTLPLVFSSEAYASCSRQPRVLTC